MKIYHNPRCRKSLETLQMIHDAGKDVEIIEYLKTPPTFNELKEILIQLNIPAEQLLRKNEAVYKEQYKGKSFTDDEWIEVMIANPKLIERPIVVKGGKAILGRPPENVNAFL